MPSAGRTVIAASVINCFFRSQAILEQLFGTLAEWTALWRVACPLTLADTTGSWQAAANRPAEADDPHSMRESSTPAEAISLRRICLRALSMSLKYRLLAACLPSELK